MGMLKYLSVVMKDDTKENDAASSGIAEVMDVDQIINSKNKYLNLIETKIKQWQVELKGILVVNYKQKSNENSDAHYRRICDQMESAIETATARLESIKLILQRRREHLLIFFVLFISFSIPMYKFMMQLHVNTPKTNGGWQNYTSYDFEMGKIRWVLKQKSITAKHARLMRCALEATWKNVNLEYDGKKYTFHGKTKKEVINGLFQRWN